MSKFEIKTNLKTLNEHQPRSSEYITEAHLQRYEQNVIEQTIGLCLADMFIRNEQIVFVKSKLKPNDQIQWQFYEQAKQLANIQQVDEMISTSAQIQTIFPQIFTQAKQSHMNQVKSIPEYALTHARNTPAYYEQRTNRNYTQNIALSYHIQHYILPVKKDENQGDQIPAQLQKLLEDIGGKYA